MHLLGDKIYENMTKKETMNEETKRAIALHKMIRLISFALGGDGYLNFIGNEWGHPGYIEFPS